MASLEILLKSGNLKGYNRQDSIATIIEILSIANVASNEIEVTYKNNSNQKKIEIYIDFLLENNFLAKTVDKDGKVVFVTTESGKNFVKDFCIIQNKQQEYPLENA